MHFTTTTALIILGSASTMASPYGQPIVESSSSSSSSAPPLEGYTAPAGVYGGGVQTSSGSAPAPTMPAGTLTGGYGNPALPTLSSTSSGKPHHSGLPSECGHRFPEIPRSIDFSHNATVACPAEMEGHKACSTDETMIAICQDGKWCPKSCGKSTHGWDLSCRSYVRLPFFEEVGVYTECTGFEDWLVPEPNRNPFRFGGHGPVVFPEHHHSSSMSMSDAMPTMPTMPAAATYGGGPADMTGSSTTSSTTASATAKTY